MGGSWSSERGVKRPLEVAEKTADGEQGDGSSELNTPKRKRFQSTAQYITRKLFEEGTDSDVSIVALGKAWHLHRLYLSQCPYFDSMFNREWSESRQQEISIEITDDNIDVEALRMAFRSLYTDSILVKPVQVIGVLAAASFLQLEPLIDHCRRVIKDTIMCQSVCCYLTASERYGLGDVRELCWGWLLRNMMMPKHATMLSDVSEELLSSLLDTTDLWMMQVEVDIYCLLKKWVFCQLHPSWSGSNEQLHKDTAQFFKQEAKDKGCCFLQTAEGSRFVPLFLKVRWMYVINDSACIQSLKDDNIVPIGWLDEVFRFCWTSHLRAEQGIDMGPSEVSEEEFHRWAMRCGRVLQLEQEYHWRWLGYSYGLDLLFTLRNKVLTIRRNCGSSQHYPGSLSQQEARQVKVKVKVTAIRKKETGAVMDCGVKTLTLHREGTECVLLSLPLSTTFPLQVTMHLLYLSPPPSLPLPPSLLLPPTPLYCVPSPFPPGQGPEVGGQASGDGAAVGSGEGKRHAQARSKRAAKLASAGNTANSAGNTSTAGSMGNTTSSVDVSPSANSAGNTSTASSMGNTTRSVDVSPSAGSAGNTSTASSVKSSTAVVGEHSTAGCFRNNTVTDNCAASSSSGVNTDRSTASSAENPTASSNMNNATANDSYAASCSSAVNSDNSSTASSTENSTACSSGSSSTAGSIMNSATANSNYAASSSSAVNRPAVNSDQV